MANTKRPTGRTRDAFLPAGHMPHPGTLARQPAGTRARSMWCGLAQFLRDELLLEVPSDERAHCSQKHKGGNSHPNGGFESVIHVHREPPQKRSGRPRPSVVPFPAGLPERNAPKKSGRLGGERPAALEPETRSHQLGSAGGTPALPVLVSSRNLRALTCCLAPNICSSSPCRQVFAPARPRRGVASPGARRL
jgi:hypothetical protein